MGVGVFPFQRKGQIHRAVTAFQILSMQMFDLQQMGFQGGAQLVGEHGHAVFHPFAIAHHNQLLGEVQIFDTQAHTFHEAQAAPIQEFSHHLIFIRHMPQDGLHFGFGQDDGQALGLFGPDNIGQRLQLLLQDFAVEEGDGAQGLALGGGGHVLFDGQMGQEGRDFGGAHVLGVAAVVKQDEAFDPIVVSVFSAAGIMLEAHGLADLVEERFRFRGSRHGVHPGASESCAVARKTQENYSKSQGSAPEMASGAWPQKRISISVKDIAQAYYTEKFCF